MRLKILQLNINGLTWKENVAKYLANNTFDILQLQEVAGKDTTIGNFSTKEDTVNEVQKMLGPKFRPYIAKTNAVDSSPTAYFGNATFIHTDITIIRHETTYLHERKTPFPSVSSAYGELGRSVLAIKIATDSTPLWLLNTHMAWGPTPDDTPLKLRQGKKLIDMVEKLKEPFILTGDFNVVSTSEIVKGLEKYGKNLTSLHHIENTLNPRLHSAKQLFPPGLAVDYIFTSPQIETLDYYVVKEDISDHLGVVGVFSV